MRIVQKRAGLNATFDFGPEELCYVFSRSGVKSGSSIAYHKIPLRTSRREIKAWWLRYLTVAYLTLCCLACFVFPAGIERQALTVYFATLAYLFVCLCSLLRWQGGIITFPLTPPLIVLDGNKKDYIFAAIAQRRRDAMRRHFARIDEARPYYEEAGKIAWLREENIITAQEYRVLRDKIAILRDKALRQNTPHG